MREFGDVSADRVRNPEADDPRMDNARPAAQEPVVSLPQALADWTDFDVAAHAIGVGLGVFGPGSKMRDHKHVFWTDNPLGNALDEVLHALVEGGVLDKKTIASDPDPHGTWHRARYRWRVNENAVDPTGDERGHIND